MKKRLFISAFIIFTLFIMVGCEKKEENNTNFNTLNNTKQLDHKVYKNMKISSSNASALLYNVNSLFGEISEVSSGDKYYKPTILVEFDVSSGKAINATFYGYFIDYDDNEWVNKAIEKYDSSSNEHKKHFTNVQKGRINDNISYLKSDLDVNSHIFTQFISTYLIEGQDIEKYKDEIYYSRLDNYSTTPVVEVGENYFEESLESIRIEWSDSQISAY